jgi:hypothetical protein
MGASQNSHNCSIAASADDQRGAGAAGGVDRAVGDRDADQVNQGQAKADRDGGETLGARSSVAPKMIMRGT